MPLKEGSNRYVVSFPPGLKEKAEVLAQANGRTLNNWIVWLIESNIRASMRHMTINVQIRLKTGSMLAGRADIDHKASVDMFIDKLHGRIGAYYPSANVGTVPDDGNGEPEVRVYMYPPNAGLERMVQVDVEVMIDELLQDETAWLVKRP